MLVAACGAPPAAAPRPVPAPAPVVTAELVPEVGPQPLGPPRVPVRPPSGPRRRDDDLLLERPRVYDLGRTIDVAETDFLSRCVRELVLAHPEPARRALILTVSQYSTTCDGEGRVVLGHPLGVDSRDRRSRSDLAFSGTLSPRGIDLALRVAYCTGESVSPDRIAIVADGEAWLSPRLEFRREGTRCDVAELPYTRLLGRVLAGAIAASEASLRFEATAVLGELAIDDTMKHELRVVLDALAALGIR